MQLLATLTSLVLSLALVSEATPTPARRAGDNGYCKQLLSTCAKSAYGLTNPWSDLSCVFGAACFGQVDSFLAAVAEAKHETKVPASRNVLRMTQTFFNYISTDKKIITQQNYIDGVYSTLATTKGPFPDVAFVIGDYSRLVDWTATCKGKGIPFKNFADYYQFSATVRSPGCGGVTTEPPIPVSTIVPITRGPTPTITSVRVTTAPTPAGDASCITMFQTCVAQVNKSVTDAWTHKACLFAATCFGGQRPVDGLLSTVFGTKGGSGTFTPSLTQARLSTDTMKSISTDKKTITQQNWIDGYYSLLSSIGGPFPSSAGVVIDDFSRLKSWTGFCTGGIPFKNVVDYFQYSATVSSNKSC